MTPSAAEDQDGRPAMGRRDLADLSALADGSLPAGRRAEVEARIAASPGGGALLDAERRAVETLRRAAPVRAPSSLRERIAADRARAGRAPRQRRAVLGGALATAAAVIVLVLVLALPGGVPGSPSVSQAASLALRGVSSPAPPPARAAPLVKLSRDVDEVYFPNWAALGWTASGERDDRIDGRLTSTIYYSGRGGAQVAYTIVGGPALTEPGGAALSHLNGIQLRSIALGRRLVVTWRRGGHTCILSSAQVPDKVLLALAAWRP